MTWRLDPNDVWEEDWEKINPEPYPEPTVLNESHDLVWRMSETFERIEWHRARWEAFKIAFPEVLIGSKVAAGF